MRPIDEARTEDLLENLSRRDRAQSFSTLHQRRWELRRILGIGLPMAFSNMARCLSDMGVAVILGRYDTLYLAAVSVSSIWTGITDVAMFSGLGQLSALCSQAKGAGNMLLLGTWLQIYIVLAVVATVPLAALRWATTPVLRAVGISEDVAHFAGVYAKWSQGAVFFDLCFCAVKEFYAAQGITWPDAFIDAAFLFINLSVVYVLVHVFQMGVIGVAIAVSIGRLARTLVYVLFCWRMGFHRESWGGWSCKEIFVWARWKTLLALTIPAAVGGLAEELQFEVCALLAARMGAVDTAAFNLILNLFFVCLILGMSIGDATGIRMAHHIGAGNITSAKRACWLGLHVASGSGIFFFLLCIAFFEPMAHMFSTDPAVQHELEKQKWAAGPAIWLMSVFFVIISMLTKQGRSALIGFVIPLLCWGAGLPSSYFLSRTDGVRGIMIGLIIGYSLALVALFVAFLRSDWPALVAKALESAERGPAQQPPQPANGTEQETTSVGGLARTRRTSITMAPAPSYLLPEPEET